MHFAKRDPQVHLHTFTFGYTDIDIIAQLWHADTWNALEKVFTDGANEIHVHSWSSALGILCSSAATFNMLA